MEGEAGAAKILLRRSWGKVFVQGRGENGLDQGDKNDDGEKKKTHGMFWRWKG